MLHVKPGPGQWSFLAWLDPSEACSIVQVPKRSTPDRSRKIIVKVWIQVDSKGTLIARVLKLQEAVLQGYEVNEY